MKEWQSWKSLKVLALPGGKYAVFLYKGTYQKLGAVYDTIYGKLVPEAGYQLDARPMFEKYLNDP